MGAFREEDKSHTVVEILHTLNVSQQLEAIVLSISVSPAPSLAERTRKSTTVSPPLRHPAASERYASCLLVCKIDVAS